MQYIARPLEVLFAAAFLLIMQGVLWPPITYLSKKAAKLDVSDPLSAAMHAALIAFLVIVGLVRWRAMLAALVIAWPLLLLLALAFFSAFWSDAPELVIRRSTTLAATTLFAIYLAARFDLAELLSLLVKLNAIAVIGSFLVMVVAPHLGLSGTEDYPNAWRGLFTDKNILGSVCGLGIIVAAYALWRGYGSRLALAALLAGNVILLYLSQSATPIVLLCASAYAALVAGTFRRRDRAGLLLGFILAVIGIFGIASLAFGWDAILAFLGRKPTLTGRSDIWAMVLGYIERRPWLGYGFGAFWRNEAVEARTIWGMLFWTVPHAHNALLEIGLALGIVGMASATLVWLIAFYRALRVLSLPRAKHVVFCVSLLVAIFLVNVTEYAFMRADTYVWVLFCVAFVYLGFELAARRVERSVPAPKGPPAIAAIRYPATPQPSRT